MRRWAAPADSLTRAHRQEREDGVHGTAGIDVDTVEFVPIDASKPINPIRLRQLMLVQKERITAVAEDVFHREHTDLTDVWFVTILCVVASIRAHQADSLVMSNGIFALGRLAQSAVGLKKFAAALRGLETTVQSMGLCDYDNIMASNGCLAIARICHVPDIAIHEDREIAFQVIDVNAQIQRRALDEGALEAIFKSESDHGHDPVVSRAFAEAMGGLSVGNQHLSLDQVAEGARRICKAMNHNFHEIEPLKDHFPTIFDEVHGKDEFVTAHGAKSLGSMVLCKSTHKAAGQDSRFPYLVSDPAKQDAIADVSVCVDEWVSGSAYLCSCFRSVFILLFSLYQYRDSVAFGARFDLRNTGHKRVVRVQHAMCVTVNSMQLRLHVVLAVMCARRDGMHSSITCRVCSTRIVLQYRVAYHTIAKYLYIAPQHSSNNGVHRRPT